MQWGTFSKKRERYYYNILMSGDLTGLGLYMFNSKKEEDMEEWESVFQYIFYLLQLIIDLCVQLSCSLKNTVS